jgi:hypothetical protein
VSDRTETRTGWLSPDELSVVRDQVPLVYVEAVPVRVDGEGRIAEVALLLALRPDGTINRAVVSGRVLHGELVRTALVRNLEKDLGPVALPRLPVSPSPFTVVEYFPDESVTGFQDPRHHAVSLAYVVPVDGECQPSQDALDLVWVTPEEAVSPRVQEEMSTGHARLVRLALAYGGALP